MLFEGCYFIAFVYAAVKEDRPADLYFIYPEVYKKAFAASIFTSDTTALPFNGSKIPRVEPTFLCSQILAYTGIKASIILEKRQVP